MHSDHHCHSSADLEHTQKNNIMSSTLLLDSLSKVPKHLVTRKICLVSNLNDHQTKQHTSSSNHLFHHQPFHKQHSSTSHYQVSYFQSNKSLKFASSSLKTYFSKSSSLIQSSSNSTNVDHNNHSQLTNNYSIGTVYEIADLPLSPITLKVSFLFKK